MSVYKSQRTESKAKYVYHCQNLLLYSLRLIRKMPKRDKDIILNDMLCLINLCYDLCVEANDYYMTKNMSRSSFEEREKKLQEARAKLSSFSAKVTILAILLQEGESVFTSREARENAFSKWGSMIKEERRLLTGVMESDKKRWREYHPNKKTSKKENTTEENIINANIESLSQNLVLKEKKQELEDEYDLEKIFSVVKKKH